MKTRNYKPQINNFYLQTYDGAYGPHLKDQNKIQFRRTYSPTLRAKKLQSYKIQLLEATEL